MRENTKVDMKDLGARVKEARIRCKMSQMDLAEACSISVPYVSDIERGKKCFSVDILFRIALALQVSTDWLLRLDLPQTNYAYHKDAAELLADCSQEEALLLIDLLDSTKEIIRKRAYKSKQTG